MAVDLEDPDLITAVKAYVTAAGLVVTDTRLADVLEAEFIDQGNRYRQPLEHADYVASPLFEGLKRRVAHNIAVSALALGAQMPLSDPSGSTNAVGGTDPEVRRWEGPYRKRPIG